MSLFEALGGAPPLVNPQSFPPQPPPSNPGQIDYNVLQQPEELRRDDHLSETPEEGDLVCLDRFFDRVQ
ncbi:hypothetical protein FA13DRAFT_1735756 [Coprinellus micaceus]|uniref:Uncharacterized protein n=1 Tax=Coprinellus micaceus TaxID=71717 RepID=A0A4Y7T4A6_COPMI|nr:hypothetical protein FA13DRAFT_1735756 [Coprinellus micaceus]